MTKQTPTLHAHFKGIEASQATTLESNHRYVIRLDGRSFGTFTRGFKKPYDLNFMNAMDSAAVALCKEVSGSTRAYVQSDEMSIFFNDLASDSTELWFGGKREKIISVAASIVTASFINAIGDIKGGFPSFDARLLPLENKEEENKYILWRAKDAHKNAISMAAECVASHAQLTGMGTAERRELLKGTEFSEENLPNGFLYGRDITKAERLEWVEFTHGKTQEVRRVEALRTRWEPTPHKL